MRPLGARVIDKADHGSLKTVAHGRGVIGWELGPLSRSKNQTMNKIVLAIVLTAGVATAAQAQYRPSGGEKSLEVNFAPLGGNPVMITGIKLRSFASQESAFRIGFFVGHSSTTTITQEEDNDVDLPFPMLELESVNRSTTISVQPGIERHLAGTDRLSPYLGGFVNIGYTATSSRTEQQIALGAIATPTQDVGHRIERGGQLNLGLNAVAGFDYYIAEHLFLGTELGFGFAMNRDLVNRVEVRDATLNTDNTVLVERTTESDSVQGNRSSWQIGPNVVGQLRLGWLF
jgi:hypothetical protein